MAKEFDLKILASDHKFYEGKCRDIVIPTEMGYFGILANHDDIALAMVPGTIHFSCPAEERSASEAGKGEKANGSAQTGTQTGEGGASDSGYVTRYAVTGTGIATVRDNSVNILVDFAEKPEEIDEKRAKEARERAKEQLRQKRSITEYERSQASLARAMARLSGRRLLDKDL